MTRGRTLRKSVVWAALVLVAVSALWIVTIEISYRRNVSHLPALIDFHRHVITYMWKA